jgi:hypothetical protein
VDTSVIAFDGKTLSVAVSSSRVVRCAVSKYTVPAIAYVSCGTPRIVSAVDDWLDEARPDVTDPPKFYPEADAFFGVVIKGGEAFTMARGMGEYWKFPVIEFNPLPGPTVWAVSSVTGRATTAAAWASPAYLWARARILFARHVPLWAGVLVGVHSVDVSDIFHGFADG